MTPHTRTPRQQRGVALITAILIVALATILAVNVGSKGYRDQRRSGTLFALDQAVEVAYGAEALAADTLFKDGANSAKTDDFTEAWAVPLPPMPVDEGYRQVEGHLDDMQGRFNLNSLVKFENGVYKRDENAVKRFKRLLDILALEEKWADLITDWIDTDNDPSFPDGGEDNVYTSLTPGYRPPNMPITRTSELLSMQDFGRERFLKLEPFITALPMGTTLNLCTAPGELLDALVEGRREFTTGRDNTITLRKDRCFPNKQEFIGPLQGDEKQELENLV